MNIHGDIYEIHSFCPICDMQIFGDEYVKGVDQYSRSIYATDYVCCDCVDFNLTMNSTQRELESRIKLEIQRKMRNGS